MSRCPKCGAEMEDGCVIYGVPMPALESEEIKEALGKPPAKICRICGAVFVNGIEVPTVK